MDQPSGAHLTHHASHLQVPCPREEIPAQVPPREQSQSVLQPPPPCGTSGLCPETAAAAAAATTTVIQLKFREGFIVKVVMYVELRYYYSTLVLQ